MFLKTFFQHLCLLQCIGYKCGAICWFWPTRNVSEIIWFLWTKITCQTWSVIMVTYTKLEVIIFWYMTVIAKFFLKLQFGLKICFLWSCAENQFLPVFHSCAFIGYLHAHAILMCFRVLCVRKSILVTKSSVQINSGVVWIPYLASCTKETTVCLIFVSFWMVDLHAQVNSCFPALIPNTQENWPERWVTALVLTYTIFLKWILKKYLRKCKWMGWITKGLVVTWKIGNGGKIPSLNLHSVNLYFFSQSKVFSFSLPLHYLFFPKLYATLLPGFWILLT